MEEAVSLRRDGAVAHLRFNRPAQLNAINIATARSFLACCEKIAATPGIRAVILGGEGDAFGVGGDLKEIQDGQFVELIDPVHSAVRLISELDVPFIARLHGVAAGGSLSVAMACDLAVAAEGTKFNLAYVNIGATCDGSASWSLPRIAGLRNAMAIALLGETFDAAEAYRCGLVNKVVAPTQLDATVDAIAQRLASGPKLAIGRIKRLMRSSMENDLSTQLELEKSQFVTNAQSDDFRGAVAAFLGKTRPVFKGS